MFQSVCVFCASASGSDPAFLTAASQLGELLARSGRTLVYGGAHVGLMGAVADSALAHGGKVIGVIPRSLVEREIAHRGLTDLRVVPTMHERKAAMADLADSFIALPGGVGTLDELFEALSWAHLGIHRKPVGLLNISGFYDLLIKFLDHAVTAGVLKPATRELLMVSHDATDLLRRLDAQRRPRCADHLSPSTR